MEYIDVNSLASQAIRHILAGNPPNGITPEQCGDWAETVAELYKAYDDDGTTSAKMVFSALVKSNLGLARLVAGTAENNAKTSWTLAELLAEQFPDPVWAVPNFLPQGLSFLAGRPKMGKSWMALQIAHAVGTGGHALGQKVEQGKVLYLALEDSPRRLQDRSLKQHIPATAAIRFETEWEPFTGGGIANLALAIATEGYTLVIIDTISRALGKVDQLDQTDMTLAMGSLQRVAQQYNVSLLLIDHHRKSGVDSGDPIDDIMGATSKAAVADAALGLFRQRGQSGATLKVTGRDIADQELAIEWDGEFFCWQCLGDAHQVQQDTLQFEILDAISEMGGEATITEVASFLNKDKGNISREMSELVKKGKVRRGEKVGRCVPYILIDNNDNNDNNDDNDNNSTTIDLEKGESL